MAREMTPQERAEDVYYGLQVMNAPEHNLRAADNERDVQAIVTLITETRRAALLEASKVAMTYGEQARDEDLSGSYTSELIVQALDRLAQEG